MNYEARLHRVVQGLGETGIDALLVTDLLNVQYLTGFSGTNGQLLVRSGEATFLTDPRYSARASSLVQGAEIVVYPNGLMDVLPERVSGSARVGIEASTVTVAQEARFRERLKGVELVPTQDLVESLRRSKDEDEVELLRRAVDLTDDAFTWVLDRLVPGASERQIALDLEMKLRGDGADGVSFPPIVGSGPLTAHIHHTPTERTLREGDLVLLDFGCRIGGYCSDLTRTVGVAPLSDEYKERYETVLAAQLTGIESVAPGTATKDVDAAARAVIDEAGLGDHFTHGLGHGVGLDVHEAPRFNRTSDEELVAGDVVTVEPGVYVVDDGGIRIEDDVLVTGSGSEVLNRAPKKELLEL